MKTYSLQETPSPSTHESSGRVWAFDLGKASIGEAVRENTTFLHKASLLIPKDFAETQTAASRRRMWRTRLAHKAREDWFDQIWKFAGLKALNKRKTWKNPQSGKWELQHAADERLEREFPPKGDSTCYTSSLLRIKLLQGESLEDWQIYKALHSAIQKRGYGRVPWANREAKRSGKTEEQIEAELSKLDPDYRSAVEAWDKFKQEICDESYHFPAYYDAWKMGLWFPGELRERIDCRAQSTRKVRFPREKVDQEIFALATHATAQLPALQEAFRKIQINGWTSLSGKHFDMHAASLAEFFLHGPAGAADQQSTDNFASWLTFRKAGGIHPGSEDDWMGATGQKTPRFDNRIINKCALIPRLQVCNVTVRFNQQSGKLVEESLLASEVTFLMKLKNSLVREGVGQRKLTAQEIRTIFKVLSTEAVNHSLESKDYSRKVIESFSLSSKDWGRKKGIKELELYPLMGHEEIRSPKSEGRSRFSRPALRLMKSLILSGKKPGEYLKELTTQNSDLMQEIGMDIYDQEPVRTDAAVKNYAANSRPRILTSDLKFLSALAESNDSWDGLYFPEQKLDALEVNHSDASGKLDKNAAIRELLGSINDPIVRHRLGVFSKRLHVLESGSSNDGSGYGIPQTVVIEFIRDNLPESFLSQKSQRDYSAWIRENEKARKEADEQAKALGVTEKSGRLKYMLFKAQGGECVYCQQPFQATELANYQIEHIVPRKQSGPDAMVNYVLAHAKCNEDKGDLTPFQWKYGKPGWDAYETCVKRHSTKLRNRKVQLLLREDAVDLVDRYTSLAETAWISRLAQKIVSIHFGWRNGVDEQGRKRVVVISGGLTARVRRRYHLNSLLAKPPEGTTDLDEWEQKAEKNRSDHRHHALDAMVLSFLPQWVRDSNKERFFRFPDPVHANALAFFGKEISEVMPENIAFEKAPLAETIYGGRRSGPKTVIVQRVAVFDLGLESVSPSKKAFRAKYLAKQIQSVRDPVIAKALRNFLDQSDSLDETHWKAFCENLRITKKDGTPGSRVLKVNVTVGEADEYAEMSKDGSGAYRRGKKSHKGQIIFWNELGKLEVQPVYTHSSPSKERARIQSLGKSAKFHGFFQSNCTICLTKPVETQNYKLVERNELNQKRRVSGSEPLPAGTYILNTIVTKNHDVELTRQDGKKIACQLRYLVEAGMKRA